MVADDLVDGTESGIDGTVADANALQALALTLQRNLGGSGDDVTAVDDVVVQLIGVTYNYIKLFYHTFMYLVT